jgi:phosphoheptose isomerase
VITVSSSTLINRHPDIYDPALRAFLDQQRPGDPRIAISSSGSSMNIRNAVTAARARDCVVATFSGFKPDNALRALGAMHVHVPSME